MPDTPKPGTPLPWHTENEGRAIVNAKGVWLVGDNGMTEENAAYIAHACNRLPELEAKLAELEKPCVWTWEGKFCCFTASCGANVGPIPRDYVTTPFKFCPYCGHPITEESEA